MNIAGEFEEDLKGQKDGSIENNYILFWYN